MSDAAFIDTHAHYFDKKFDTLPGGAAGLLTDCAISATVLSRIRKTADLADGDNTEAVTRIVREQLHKRFLDRRALRAFPYAQVYNHRALERLRKNRAEFQQELRRRRETMRADAEQLERRLRDELNQRRNASK